MIRPPFIAALFCITFLGSALADVPEVKVDKDRNLRVSVGQIDALGKGKVPFTAEKWAVMTRGQVANEANLFDSGLAFDLDGDGKTTGVFKFTCETGTATLHLPSGPVALKPFKTGDHFGYQDRIRKLGAQGGYLALYAPCLPGSAFLGFDSPNRPIAVEQVDGPVVQIIVFEPLSDPHSKSEMGLADLKVDGQSSPARIRQGRTYEPLFGTGLTWMVVHWAMVPVKSESVVTARITGPDKSGSVMARMNSASEPMKRIIGRPSFMRLASRPGRNFFVDLATRGLQAHKAKDIDAMVALVPANRAAEAKKRISEGGRAHDKLFGEKSWRWQAVQRWQGAIAQTRFTKGEVRVIFGTSQKDWILCVRIVEQDGAWFFKDFKRQTKAAFEIWGSPLE